LTKKSAGCPNVSSFFKLVIVLDVLDPFPSILCQSLYGIALKAIDPHFGPAAIPADEAGLPVALKLVLAHQDLAVVDQHYPVALVGANGVVLDVDDWSYGHYAVEIATDVVFRYQKFLAVQQKHPLATGLFDLAVVYVVVDVSGAF